MPFRPLRALRRAFVVAAATLALGACAGAAPAPRDPLDALRSAAARGAGRRERSGACCSASCSSPAARPARAIEARKRLDAPARRGEEGPLRVARARGGRRGARPLPQRRRRPHLDAAHGGADERAPRRAARRVVRDEPPARPAGGRRRPLVAGARRREAHDRAARQRRLARARRAGRVVEPRRLPRGDARRARRAGRVPGRRDRGGGQALRLRGEGAHRGALRSRRGRRPPRALRGRARGALAGRLPARSAAPRAAAHPAGRARRLRAPRPRARRRASTTSRPSSTCPPIARSIVAVQGAFAIFVDDAEVLTRDTRSGGSGRASARASGSRRAATASSRASRGPETSIRVDDPERHAARRRGLRRSGAALRHRAARGPAGSRTRSTPFLAAVGVPPQRGMPRPRSARDTGDPISRALAAYLAHVEGQDDLGAVLIEPLVDGAAAARDGPALALAGRRSSRRIPIYPAERRARPREGRARAGRGEGPGALVAALLARCSTRRDKCGRARGRAEARGARRPLPRGAGHPEGPRARSTRASAGSAEHDRAVRARGGALPRRRRRAARRCSTSTTRRATSRAPTSVAARIQRARPRDRGRLRARRRAARLRSRHRRSSSGSATLRKDRRDIAARIADLLTRAGGSQRVDGEARGAPCAKKPQDAGGAARARRRALRPRRTAARSAGRSSTRSTPAPRPRRSATRSSWSTASPSSRPTASTAAR